MYKRATLDIEQSEDRCDCHVFPCSIQYDGKVDKSKFQIVETPALTAMLRGRPLQGYSLDLEKLGYVGYSMQIEPQVKSTQEEEEYEEDLEDETPKEQVPDKYSTQGKPFNRIVVWEHGKPPGPADPWGQKLEQLLTFSKCLSI